jgi:hypothetical protein
MAIPDRTTPPKTARRPSALRAFWGKYGLIVVGNVVFFALLYFVQYRPNSRENRANELLTLAQREEAEGHLEAADAVYAKIVADYADCSAIRIAGERLPKVRKLARSKRETQPPLPKACTPGIDLRELLEMRPSQYLTELVAAYYPELHPAERERYFRVLDGYVWIAFNRDRVPLAKLRDNPAFRAGELQQRYFAIRASARFTPDYWLDDFKVKNLGFFALHNAVVELSVTQGKSSKKASVRVRELLPEAELDVLEFNVGKHGGAVQVEGSILADEGQSRWQARL